LQKVHVEIVFENFDKKFNVSFSSTFFVLSRFRVFFSDGISKTHSLTSLFFPFFFVAPLGPGVRTRIPHAPGYGDAMKPFATPPLLC
jgi:hypothetical protein